MGRDHLIFILKLLITALLVSVLLVTVDWRGSLSSIANISLFYAILLIAIGVFMIAISSLKWQIFLHARGIHVPLTRLTLLYVVGYFFNNLLPSNVGGDVARSFALGRQIRNQADVFSSVFLERFTGVLGLLILALAAFILNPLLVVERPQLGVLLLALLGTLAVVLLLLFTGGARKLLDIMAHWKPLVKVQKKAIRFVEAVHSFRSQPVVLTKGMAISFLFHVMTTVNTYVVCLALGIDISILDIAVIVPIILVVSMVPISLNAIGIWEVSFVYFFSLADVPAAAALSIALTLRAKNLFFSLLGGGIFGFWRSLFQATEDREHVVQY